jgi:hypothetical protein
MIFAAGAAGRGYRRNVLLAAPPRPLARSSARPLLVILAGLASTVLGAAAFATRRVRRLEDDLPDVIPSGIVTRDKNALQDAADRRLATGKGTR